MHFRSWHHVVTGRSSPGRYDDTKTSAKREPVGSVACTPHPITQTFHSRRRWSQPLKRNAPPKRGISVEMGYPRPLNLSSVSRTRDRQPLVTTGAGGGYLPSGALPIGYLPTGAAAGGGGSLRGRSA